MLAPCRNTVQCLVFLDRVYSLASESRGVVRAAVGLLGNVPQDATTLQVLLCGLSVMSDDGSRSDGHK